MFLSIIWTALFASKASHAHRLAYRQRNPAFAKRADRTYANWKKIIFVSCERA